MLVAIIMANMAANGHGLLMWRYLKTVSPSPRLNL